MSGYGFGRKPAGRNTDESGAGGGADAPERLDFTGIPRTPVNLDPAREEAAIRRGDALGFVDRGAARDIQADTSEGAPSTRRRRRSAQPQMSVFIKGPKDTLEWFIEYTNQQGHRSYWEALEEFRSLVESK
ncbi:hypothetical protein [Novosphingobium soli]|uniref:Uncharacterized protein n=1 Tax=Novosphingobium soli TaxID=574956 RepID=A0ABV6CY75_9SPHN